MRTTSGGLPRLRKAIAVLCALAFIAPSGRAALLEVTNNAQDNATPGSLGAALAGTGGAGTSDTIIFSPFITQTVNSAAISPSAAQTTVNNLTLDGNQQTVVFTGGMTVVGGGALSVNGLTASGITVSGGLLSASNSSLSGLTLDGGTFQTRDGGATTGVVLVGSGNGTNVIDADGNDPTISGITGSGDLTVDSTRAGGVLTFTAACGGTCYTGGTFVNSGTLRLGIASALATGGDLTTTPGGTFDLNGFAQTLGTVANGGTVVTGEGTLTAADYSGTGTLSVALKPGLTNLVMTGPATLDGTLAVTGHPAPGLYTIVSAVGAGTLSGAFNPPTLPYGVTEKLLTTDGLDGTVRIDILTDTPFTFAGQSPNQAAVGNAFNTASYTATGDLGSIIARLSAMSPTQADAALAEIGPVSYAALSGMSLAGSGVQAAAVTQRLTGLQAGGASPDGSRYASFDVRGPSLSPGTLVAELPGEVSAAYSGDKDRLFDPSSRWGLFVSGLGTFDHLDSINGAAGYQPGYSVTATGETVGADYRFNEHFAAGAAGGYVNSFAAISGNGGTVYGQSARLGVYGTAYNDDFHANLYLGGAHDFYDTSRNVSVFSRTATAEPSGQEFNLDATAGWDLKDGSAVVSPFFGLGYDLMLLGPFTESGAGALDLALAGQTAESLRSTMGVKVSRRFKPSWCDVAPYASLGWQHEFMDQSRELDASLASGGTGFAVRTADVAREAALLGAGVDLDWTPGFSTRLAYSGELREDYLADTFSGSLRWRF